MLDVPGTKLRLATLNHEADRILAVNWDTEQTQSIVVLDLKGKELIKVAVPKNRL